MSPIRLLNDWSYSGWCKSGFRPNWRTRVADAVLWKYYIFLAILRCVACINGCELRDSVVVWQRPLYRVKTVLCLLAGRHWPGESYAFDGVCVAWWDGEMTGYYEPEWEDSRVEVGYGWRNWYVDFTERRGLR